MAKRYVDPVVRFFSFVLKENDCWVWRGFTWHKGYACFKVGGKNVRAHRWAFEQFRRQEIPADKVLDHLCRNPSCVNPWHLEIVTPRENLMRGNTLAAMNAVKLSCVNGHPLAGDNLLITPQGWRSCRLCRLERVRRWRARIAERD